MTDRILTPTVPPKHFPPMPSKPSVRARFSIACEGHEVALPPGKLVMGRGSRCHIVVDDLLASREHARLTVTEDSVVVEDLGSTNGVYVNEKRIESPTPLVQGDRMVVGTQELELREHVDRPQQDERAMDFKDLAMIVPMRPPRSPLLDMDEPGIPSPPPPRSNGLVQTEKADVVTTLGRLADRMLTMGRFDAAERVLKGQLHEVLAGARAGRPVRPDVFDVAVEYGLRLAEVTRKGSWIDYVVEMHMIDARVMDGPVIARVAALLPVAADVDKEMFFFYKEAIRGKRDDLPLADQIACDRILKLELPA
jgi:FHA domain